MAAGIKGHVVETVRQKRCEEGQRWRDEGMWVILLLSNTIPVHAGLLLSVHPAIIGPDRPAVIGFAPFLLLSLSKDSPESQNLLFSPFAFLHPHGCCVSLDMSLAPLLH